MTASRHPATYTRLKQKRLSMRMNAWPINDEDVSVCRCFLDVGCSQCVGKVAYVSQVVGVPLNIT